MVGRTRESSPTRLARLAFELELSNSVFGIFRISAGSSRHVIALSNLLAEREPDECLGFCSPCFVVDKHGRTIGRLLFSGDDLEGLQGLENRGYVGSPVASRSYRGSTCRTPSCWLPLLKFEMQGSVSYAGACVGDEDRGFDDYAGYVWRWTGVITCCK